MLMADLPDPGLARVAEETGGGYIEIRLGQDLGAAFAGVADELHTQYLLGFASQARRQGARHQRAGDPGGAEAASAQELRRTERLVTLVPTGAGRESGDRAVACSWSATRAWRPFHRLTGCQCDVAVGRWCCNFFAR